MTEFKIDKCVELPKTSSRNPLAIALVQCAVGDSVFVPNGAMDYPDVQYAMQKASYSGGKFSRRKQPGGTRVWRIK